MQDFSAATYKNILDHMLSLVPDTYDKRDTSPIQTAVGPAAYVLEGFYLSLDLVQKQAFVQTASGDSLDLLAVLAGITRKQASAAVKIGIFDCAVPIGARFSTINGTESINFVVISTITEGSTYRLQAETAGDIGNRYSGPVLPIDSIEGLNSAQLTDLLIPGENTEEDEPFRARIIERLNSRSFGGNVAQYVEEIEAIDGVGAVQVYPVWDGGGTVCCSILGADFRPASSDLVQMVQNAIDPPPGQGLGLGLAPIGAQVTVTAPKTVPVDISATLTLASGHELETVQQPAQDAVSAYLLQIRKNWDVNISSTAIAYSAEVYLARVLAALISLDGVVNVSALTLNGIAADMALQQTGALQQVPVLGKVELHGT